MTVAMRERSPVYAKNRDKRVISIANGLWVPQRLVSHQPGCSRGYFCEKLGDSWVRLRDKGAPHFDPWENIHAPTTREHALLTIFGPKGLDRADDRGVV